MQALDLIEFNVALLLASVAALSVAWLTLWLVFREVNKRVQELHAGELIIMRRCKVLIPNLETPSKSKIE